MKLISEYRFCHGLGNYYLCGIRFRKPADLPANTGEHGYLPMTVARILIIFFTGNVQRWFRGIAS